MVPALSIFFMFISGIIAFGLPIVTFLIWRKKYNLHVVPLFVGAATFIVFALILQQIMHFIVLRPGIDGNIDLAISNPALFIVYGIFAAGIFEETGRFIAFHLLKKKHSGIGTGLSFGIGHGGIEAMWLVGFTMINNIVLSAMINLGIVGILGDDPTVLTSIDALKNIDSTMFLAGGFERIVAVAVHISLSMFVLCAVKVKGKLWLFPAAIVLHAIVNIAPAMYQLGFIENIWLVEGLIVIPTVLIALAAYYICKIIKRNAEAETPHTESPA